MDSVRAEVDGPALARVLANVLAFCPARSPYPIVRLDIGPGYVEVSACDTYTVGIDTVEAKTSGEWSGAVERLDAQAVEKAIRAERKTDVHLTLGEVDPQGGRLLTMVIPGGQSIGTPARVRPLEGRGDSATLFGTTEAELFDLVDELAARIARRTERPGEPRPWPLDVYFQPSLLAPFAKVRPAGASPVMGMRIVEPEIPILIKIGPSFRGAIMPVQPDRAEDEFREEMLW
ncbi:hypothetical protein [Parafrankia sp. EUN1f]|uniref:hypothetical protein n=1 Tax=Parafrankia sp. EUN1f TaxID=102897 RepID=UPI0001C4556C|nr:hypothetical protein [Parafrankia sp. EUN1f]EFC86451.1 hypothetical protein FrEUN1fDRAFT_0346 [Parafrankia sp. EUN1f]